MKIQHKAKFISQGSFFNEEACVEVDTADPNKVVPPSHAFAFTLYDRITQRAVLEDGREVKHTETKEMPGIYYIHPARVLSLENVKQEFPNEKILISNMECNDWELVIQTRAGNFQPFNPVEDTVLVLREEE